MPSHKWCLGYEDSILMHGFNVTIRRASKVGLLSSVPLPGEENHSFSPEDAAFKEPS